jgi:hypothetical protein
MLSGQQVPQRQAAAGAPSSVAELSVAMASTDTVALTAALDVFFGNTDDNDIADMFGDLL